MSIGNKIAEIRKQANMTQKDLAEKLNVSDKVISKWETGKSLPDVESMMRLSNVLGISISELYSCIEKTDAKNTEEYNEEIIWQYKKYSIISYFLLVISPFLFFMSALPWSYIDEVQHTFSFILIVSSIISLVLGILFQTAQFVRLYSYSRTKYYKEKYNNTLLKYGIIFIVALCVPIAFIYFLVLVKIVLIIY